MPDQYIRCLTRLRSRPKHQQIKVSGITRSDRSGSIETGGGIGGTTGGLGAGGGRGGGRGGSGLNEGGRGLGGGGK